MVPAEPMPAQLLLKSFEKQSQSSLPTKPVNQSQNHHFAWFYWHLSAQKPDREVALSVLRIPTPGNAPLLSSTLLSVLHSTYGSKR